MKQNKDGVQERLNLGLFLQDIYFMGNPKLSKVKIGWIILLNESQIKIHTLAHNQEWLIVISHFGFEISWNLEFELELGRNDITFSSYTQMVVTYTFQVIY